jgi:hypothetical protein
MKMYAVFCKKKKVANPTDPCLEPLAFGVDPEPKPTHLLRRQRVTLFETKAEAESAMKLTLEESAGMQFIKDFEFLILECQG